VIDEIQAISIEAGEVALEYFGHRSELAIEAKSYLDPVTEADRRLERLIVDRLRKLFPDDGILGEEGASADSRSGRTWVIDPIDGTFNFVRGTNQWSVSIGLFDGTRPTLGVLNLPAQRKLVIGGAGVPPQINGTQMLPPARFEPSRAAVMLGLGPNSADPRGTALVDFVSREAGMLFRYCGCGSVSLLNVALGEVDGYLSLGECSWDVMAALAILDQLGIRNNLHWPSVDLRDNLPLACGSPEFLAIAARFAA
jgi:myo-inositol-1(or 4)-monophosphatase